MNTAWAGLIGALVGGLIVAGGNYLVTQREAEVKIIEIAARQQYLGALAVQKGADADQGKPSVKGSLV